MWNGIRTQRSGCAGSIGLASDAVGDARMGALGVEGIGGNEQI